MTINKKEKVRVITSIERSRRWSIYEKKAILEETYEQEKSVYSLLVNMTLQLHRFSYGAARWKKGLYGVSCQDTVIPETEHKQTLERIKRLERLLGQKTEEVEILKEAIKISREKKLIWRNPWPAAGDSQ